MICSNCKNDVSDDSLYCGKCGQSLIGSDTQITRNEFTHKINENFALDFKNGGNFGERYKIIEELGKGGMGQVFKAHDNVLGIDVALKVIRPEFLSNKKMISRFKQEILLAREITHENVSRIYDFGEVDGKKFITMEFISGRTLKQIVKDDGPVDIEKAIEISKAICRGLEAAHKKEIIHRDLKPQNIMINDDGHVYITDFGLAKSIKEENVSHTGLVIGTPQYIPPELWKGEVADKRSDIYSLGIIMYEMIAGEELFQSDSDYGYLQKHIHEKPEFPAGISAKVPSFLQSLMFRCLAKEREERYQNCYDIERDLNDRIFNKGTIISEIERSIKKTGLVKIGLSLLMILIISFVVILIFEKGPPDPKKRSVAILYFKNLSGVKDLDHFSYSLPELLATDLGQSKYIRVLPDDKVSEVLKEKNYLSSNVFDQKLFESIGDEAKVNYLVQGSFIKSGEDLRITVKLRDSDTGEMLSTDYVDAPADNIFPAIDRLTTGLKRRFDLSESEILADIDNNVEEITTSSPEALNLYIRGKKLFNKADYNGSIKEFEKAVEIDPHFAMAYRDMAYAYVYLGDMKNRAKYINKTFEHIKRMSEKEKLLIYGDYYAQNPETFNKSLESYNKLLKIYPDDTNANLESGFYYLWFEDWDKAISRFQNVLANDSSDINAIRDIVVCYSGKGEYLKAENIITNFEKIFPGNSRVQILEMKYTLYMIQKKYGLALNVVKDQKNIGEINDQIFEYKRSKITLLKKNYFNTESSEFEKLLKNESLDYGQLNNLEFMFFFEGKFSRASEMISERIRSLEYPGYINDAKFKQIYFYLISNKTKIASELINKFDLAIEDRTFLYFSKSYYLKGIIQLKSGNLEECEKHAEWIRSASESSHFRKLLLRRYYHLKGLVQKKRKKYKEAVDYFLKGVDLSSHEWGSSSLFNENSALFYFELGHSYFLSGQLFESEKWLRKLGYLTLSRYFFGDLYAKSLYYLGKIFQKKGWVGKAIESYDHFILMWGNGDREIVGEMITDAEKQVKLLGTKI